VRALQEGWDCSFAYVLVNLNKPSSKTGVTQLVGRVMRQPFGRRSPIDALNQCYVISRRRTALYDQLIEDLKFEGLGDITGDIRSSSTTDTNPNVTAYRWQEKFRNAGRHLFLPVFAVSNGDGSFRRLDYEQDLACRIDWEQAELTRFFEEYQPRERRSEDIENAYDITNTGVERTRVARYENTAHEPEPLHVAKDLMDLVPNPWVAYDIANRALEGLTKKFGQKVIKEDLYSWSSFLRQRLTLEKDALAENVFREMIESGELKFIVITDEWGKTEWKPADIKYVPSDIRLLKGDDGGQLKLTLFDPLGEDAEGYNSSEKEFARFVDEHKKVFNWFRNLERKPDSYSIQGWQKHKLYPDFILTSPHPDDPTLFQRAYVVETKGEMLVGDRRSNYVEAVLRLCNEKSKEMSWSDINLAFEQRHVKYEFIPFENWKNSLAAMLSE
ncbi:MAG TPA: hypothetical protein VFX22_02385, partial [Candidatus Kapabacteria bacterium]|nr:hypothetical protein [Candidatus Kapabacteria bacterium]